MMGFDFTERMRVTLALAREESARLHHEYVGTEHMLLGLVRDDESIGVQALKGLGVDPQAIRRRVADVVRPGPSTAYSGPDLPYTSRAKKVLELAMNEANTLGHSYVGTEHLLLGLVVEGKGIAAQVLWEAGVTSDAARAEVVRILGGGQPQWLAPSIDADELEALKGKPVERVELILHYPDGQQFRRTFASHRHAAAFLTTVGPADSH